jgi:DNA repair protein RadC
MAKQNYQIEQKYYIKLKELPEEEKPREKLIKRGPDFLENAELLAIVLGTGHKKEGVMELASRIIKEYGSKAIASEKNVERLMKSLNIPKVKACQIVACFELGRRFFQENTGRLPTLRSPEDVYQYLKDMRNLKKEHFRGLYLNIKNKLIHDEIISIGTLSTNVCHPREIFQPAIEYGAAAIILVHNHPSSDPKPSKDDIRITKEIIEAGKIMGIEILDHIIIGEKGYTSLKAKRLI